MRLAHSHTCKKCRKLIDPENPSEADARSAKSDSILIDNWDNMGDDSKLRVSINSLRHDNPEDKPVLTKEQRDKVR